VLKSTIAKPFVNWVSRTTLPFVSITFIVAEFTFDVIINTPLLGLGYGKGLYLYFLGGTIIGIDEGGVHVSIVEFPVT